MGTFQNKTFRSSADASKIGMKYRALMAKHPFLAFGLPFMAVIVAGSFVLTPATAIRYEKHDRRVRQMTKEEELNVRRGARKVDMKEEYYVSFLDHFAFFMVAFLGFCLALHNGVGYLSIYSCKGEGGRDMMEGAEKIRICRERQNGVRRRKKQRRKNIRNLRGLRLMQSDNRDLLEETWTIGSSRESRDCLEKTTASCKRREKKQAETRLNMHACVCVSAPVPVTLSRKTIA